MPANYTTMTRILTALALSLTLLAPAHALTLPWEQDSSTAWPASGGQGRIEIRGDFLPDFGVEVLAAGETRAERLSTPVAVEAGPLWIYAPFGNFENFSGGEIRLATPLALRHGDRELSLGQLSLRPAVRDRIPVLQLFDARGDHLANVTHIHALIDHERALITLHNADLTGTARLAERLGRPELDGMPLGQLWLDLDLLIPADADLSGHGIDHSGEGLSCSNRPWWPQDGHEVDVALIGIGTVAGGGFEPGTGRLKITPSATLKNVGPADVPWFRQFNPASPSLYPHEPRDQHPFLVWNLYRIHDGRLEQLAASGVKHAFFSINVSCTLNCFNGNILWPGCEDTYGVGNNDSSTYQAPRHEIEASQGLWKSCGSFFDPNCTGSQTGFSGSWNNRLLVNPAELNFGPAGAQYFLDSWYVIQYDVNIWNTMGYHRITPTQGGSGGYTFNPLGAFTQGPPLNQWVPESIVANDRAHEVVTVPSLTPDNPYPFNMPQGHLRVLVKVDELDDGLWRYRYVVMNYDLDRGIDSLSIPVAGLEVSDVWMGGPPDVLSTPWSHSVAKGWLVFEAPQGDILPWFTLYNFEFTTNSAPVESAVVLNMAGTAAGDPTISVDIPGPNSQGFFLLAAEPETLGVCAGDDAEFLISAVPQGDFVDSVALTIDSPLPGGMGSSFSVNPVSPGEVSILSLSTLNVDAGDYAFTVLGTASNDLVDEVSLAVGVSEDQPGLPMLLGPADGAQAVSQGTTFEWSSEASAVSYRLQVAVDGDFESPLIDEILTTNSFVPAAPLAAWTVYEWRVSAMSYCGDSGFTLAGSFYTGSDGDNPLPTLHTIDPESAVEGGDAVVLVLNGAQFHPEAEVRWAGVVLASDWINVGSMTAQVPAGLLEFNAVVPITVFNPAPAGGSSSAILFHVLPSVLFEDRFED